ncbi:MAG TPA: DUF1257 domain-containing protein [Verrucomicrobiota bacterium]|nr:DUF1257 domain-containing protein [Verrucomicrobiota bacterium]
MSCVCILTPVVIAAWPAFSAAVVAAATSLGYQVVTEASRGLRSETTQQQSGKVSLDIPQSELVTAHLERDQKLSVTRDGVTVTFSRDARGKAALCVTGNGQSDDVLRALGEELSGRVVQHYVYQKLMDEMAARGFVVVEEETEANRAIRLKVRHWDG